MTLKVRTVPIGPRLPERMYFHHAAVILAGMDLGADLADALVSVDGVAHGKALRQVQRHRLLQVKVLAGFARGDGLQRMPVRRRGDDDGVEVLAAAASRGNRHSPCRCSLNRSVTVSSRASQTSQAAVTTTSG